MRAWTFQDAKQLKRHGPKKCPWSVGWYDGRGRKRQKRVGTKTAATAYARKLEGEAAAGLLNDERRTRWADFVERFDRDHLKTLAPVTRRVYRRSLDGFTEAVGPAYLNQADEGAVAEYRAKRLAKGVEPATVNKDLRHLRCALNKARKWKLIADRVEVELLREPERDPEFIDDNDFAKLYAACDTMTLPAGRHYSPADWWRALLTFCYLTGWRIGQVLALLRDHVDLEACTAFSPAEATKGKRDARVELHPVVVEHLRKIAGFDPAVFDWPHHERRLWAHFKRLKSEAGVDVAGAFHRLRFGFANANVDNVPADVLQRLMLHRDAKTTRRYVNMAKRMQRQGTAGKLHVPAVLAKQA